jgi:hypothetical protein
LPADDPAPPSPPPRSEVFQSLFSLSSCLTRRGYRWEGHTAACSVCLRNALELSALSKRRGGGGVWGRDLSLERSKMKPGNNTALSYFSCFEQCKGRIDLILFNLLGKIYLKIRGSIVFKKKMLQRLGERKTPAFLFFGISKNSQEQNDSSSLRFW